MARENILIRNLVYILIVLMVVIGLFFLAGRAGSQAPLFEQVYAKQIALIINKAKPGMDFEVDIFNIHNVARENNYGGSIVNINNELNTVNVKLTRGSGYNYQFFNDADVAWNIKDKGVLVLKIVEPQKLEPYKPELNEEELNDIV